MYYNLKEHQRQKKITLTRYLQDGDLLLDHENSDLISSLDKRKHYGHKRISRDRIDHYDLLLEAGKIEIFNPLIKEWRRECINKLYRLREVDMEAMFTGSAFASQFHITNCISLKRPTG